MCMQQGWTEGRVGPCVPDLRSGIALSEIYAFMGFRISFLKAILVQTKRCCLFVWLQEGDEIGGAEKSDSPMYGQPSPAKQADAAKTDVPSPMPGPHQNRHQNGCQNPMREGAGAATARLNAQPAATAPVSAPLPSLADPWAAPASASASAPGHRHMPPLLEDSSCATTPASRNPSAPSVSGDRPKSANCQQLPTKNGNRGAWGGRKDGGQHSGQQQTSRGHMGGLGSPTTGQSGGGGGGQLPFVGQFPMNGMGGMGEMGDMGAMGGMVGIWNNMAAMSAMGSMGAMGGMVLPGMMPGMWPPMPPFMFPNPMQPNPMQAAAAAAAVMSMGMGMGMGMGSFSMQQLQQQQVQQTHSQPLSSDASLPRGQNCHGPSGESGDRHCC